jgi:UDP-N-acetylglucosamine transferase subunit ALG13
MIFVTVGTHYQEFTRLIKRIDQIATKINEKIIVQRGYTKYVPKNCESFDWRSGLEDYYKKCRILITHSAMSCVEFIYKYKKPILLVPRQHKFQEHINDHQVEFAESFEKKINVKAIYNIKDLTPDLLKSYKFVGKIDDKNLKKIQNYLKKTINDLFKEK